MTILLTTTGSAHLTELAAGGTLTNSFDALIFSRGNEDASTAGETQAGLTDLTSIIRRVSPGYPKLNDTTSPRNPGAGADWWTWKFELPAGTPWVASNLAVTNYLGATFAPGTPLMVHSDEGPYAQRYDERLIVYVNAQLGETPTVYTVTEESLQNRIQRVVGFVAKTRALSAFPTGSVVEADLVRSRPRPGQYVWTGARQLGPNGEELAPEKVEWLRLSVERWDADTQAYVDYSEQALSPAVHVFARPQYGDQRWNAEGGYNIAHAWTPPDASQESTWRLTYRMELTDGDLRVWRNLVEVRFGAD